MIPNSMHISSRGFQVEMGTWQYEQVNTDTITSTSAQDSCSDVAIRSSRETLRATTPPRPPVVYPQASTEWRTRSRTNLFNRNSREIVDCRSVASIRPNRSSTDNVTTRKPYSGSTGGQAVLTREQPRYSTLCESPNRRQRCYLPWVHAVPDVLGLHTRGNLLCCKLYDAKAPISTQSKPDPHSVRSCVHLVNETKRPSGIVIECLLDSGCEVRAIIREDLARKVGWTVQADFDNIELKTSSDHSLQAIGKIRILVEDKKSGKRVDVSCFVVAKGSLPVAEMIFGQETVKRKHLDCSQKPCLVCFWASHFH